MLSVSASPLNAVAEASEVRAVADRVAHVTVSEWLAPDAPVVEVVPPLARTTDGPSDMAMAAPAAIERRARRVLRVDPALATVVVTSSDSHLPTATWHRRFDRIDSFALSVKVDDDDRRRRWLAPGHDHRQGRRTLQSFDAARGFGRFDL